jgi:hypothetical protein
MSTQPVEVYWNRHRRCWSVRCARTRRVLRHESQLALRDCTMHVSTAGRLRVLREGRRNVHAWIRGTPTDSEGRAEMPIRYNPYETIGFVNTATGEVVGRATLVTFAATGEVFTAETR